MNDSVMYVLSGTFTHNMCTYVGSHKGQLIAQLTAALRCVHERSWSARACWAARKMRRALLGHK